MERLWTPWRMQYIKGESGDEPGTCIFCELPAKGDDESVFILAREGQAFAILNKFPYNPGHLMIAPFRHVADFADLEEQELVDTSRLLRRAVAVIRDAWSPTGFNLGMNLGQFAGAGIPDHVHWHVVPRWSGDTNFMPVLGETKVLPELLEETYVKLRPLF
jgi:ATP adenylyltransferase